MSGIYVARESFATVFEGEVLQVPKGTTVREGHKLLAEYGDWFRPLVVDYEVEAPKPAPKKATPAEQPKPKAR